MIFYIIFNSLLNSFDSKSFKFDLEWLSTAVLALLLKVRFSARLLRLCCSYSCSLHIAILEFQSGRSITKNSWMAISSIRSCRNGNTFCSNWMLSNVDKWCKLSWRLQLLSAAVLILIRSLRVLFSELLLKYHHLRPEPTRYWFIQIFLISF